MDRILTFALGIVLIFVGIFGLSKFLDATTLYHQILGIVLSIGGYLGGLYYFFKSVRMGVEAYNKKHGRN